jgi:CBS-domain-containing membrane protein
MTTEVPTGTTALLFITIVTAPAAQEAENISNKFVGALAAVIVNVLVESTDVTM